MASAPSVLSTLQVGMELYGSHSEIPVTWTGFSVLLRMVMCWWVAANSCLNLIMVPFMTWPSGRADNGSNLQMVCMFKEITRPFSPQRVSILHQDRNSLSQVPSPA